MANDVYANGREISCKKADGKSICCFPDVCMTPPENPATPPGVPVPYPNTGMAKDTTDGSKKVKISDQEVLLKNKSYFKKSTGDEAGSAAKKGVVTSVNTGKVYFNAWSMDVKFEGENVVRHLDLTTHNHGSYPGNTPTWPYLDQAAFDDTSHPCHSVAKEVHAKCDKHVVRTKDDKVSKRGRKKSIEAMCDDEECAEARKCVLSPERPNNCCSYEDEEGNEKKKTPHHLIPAHCFMPAGERGKSSENVYEGCENYNSKKAPCMCVEGESKIGEHGELHDFFDSIEAENMKSESEAGSWSHTEAYNAAMETVANCCTDCDWECAGAQLDAYHQGGSPGPNISDDTQLRADPTGQYSEGFTPSSVGAGGF